MNEKLRKELSSFWKNVDKKRKEGMTDTEILNGLSKTNRTLAEKISKVRNRYSVDDKIKNDRDALNALSMGFSKKMPTVKSVALRETPTRQREEIKKPEPERKSAGEKLRDVSPVDVAGQTFGAMKQGIFGGLKQIGETIMGAASLPQQAGRYAAEKITGKPAPKEFQTVREMADKSKIFERKTPAERGGAMATEIAEYMIPGKATGKLGMRVIKEGAGLAGITAAQRGEVDKEVGTSALIGGAFPMISRIGGSIFKGISETAWSNILKRTPMEAAKKPDLAKQAAQTGIASISRKSISIKLQKRIEGVELKLDDLLNFKSGKIESKNVVKYLDDLKKSYKSIPGEGSSIKVINKTIKDFSKKKELTVKEANTIKRNIYKMISKSYGKGMLELPAKTESQKMIARGLKKEIEKIIPEAKTLNERQAIYIQMKKAIEKTIARREGKGVFGTGIGLYDLMIGGIATGASGGTAGIAAIVGAKVAGSAAVSSGTSKMINYFNSLSPTQKMIFYNGIKGVIASGKTEYEKLRTVSNK